MSRTPSTTPTAPTADTAPAPQARFWPRLGRGLRVAGQVAGQGGRSLGRAAAWAYGALDRDLRLHVAQLPVVGLSMLIPLRPVVVPRPDTGKRPLILAHGLGGRPGNFAGMAAYARLLGRRRVYLADFTRDNSLEAMAARLRDLIARVIEVNGLGSDAQVDVVAHSMGGIVARLALTDESVASRVATLVTLGSPHGGTHLARLAATETTLALRPDSQLLRELSEPDLAGGPLGVRTVAFWSRADVFLLPARSARLHGAENIELKGITHYGYLMTPRCWRAVFRVLAEAPSSPLSP